MASHGTPWHPVASHYTPQPLSSPHHTHAPRSVPTEQVLPPPPKKSGGDISTEKLTPWLRLRGLLVPALCPFWSHPRGCSLWELVYEAAPQPFALFLPCRPFAVALGSSSTYPVSLSVFHTSWERREGQGPSWETQPSTKRASESDFLHHTC